MFRIRAKPCEISDKIPIPLHMRYAGVRYGGASPLPEPHLRRFSPPCAVAVLPSVALSAVLCSIIFIVT